MPVPNLKTGQSYQLWVKQIEYNAKPFTSSHDVSKIIYAHEMLLKDEFETEYICQICDNREAFDTFSVSDFIEFSVKSFSINKHTIAFIRIITPAIVKPLKSKSHNPIMGGTAADLALRYAVEHCKYKEEDILDTAETYYVWLLQKQEGL